ncbi:fam-c protein [Plasmodium vinckei vinckei]|uniref:Fam-c protein n=1 Tax=Plasmodium vinckei vinckei TaxID=54757 RepID=A0A449BNW8_PLAVN|nr:fam-c protein [Plasmodium vinckei vinckei]VEV55102.1 fam-c protein [Plasmodium vinckei vinckei]
MNKGIFSLVCIILYGLLAVSIHCSKQKHDQSKTSGLRSRIIRAIKKINGSNKKNVIEFQRETQLNNNNNNNNEDDDIWDDDKYDDEKDYEDDGCGCCGCCG